jgi:hypothetical protein
MLLALRRDQNWTCAQVDPPSCFLDWLPDEKAIWALRSRMVSTRIRAWSVPTWAGLAPTHQQAAAGIAAARREARGSEAAWVVREAPRLYKQNG